MSGGRNGGSRLSGRVAVVAGGARNIGAAIARQFVAEGASVVIGDVLEAQGRATADELGNAVRFHHLDVADEMSWSRLVTATRMWFGDVSVLVNNAAVISFGRIVDSSTADFDACMAVNVRGSYLGMRTVVPSMTAAGGGSIVNISSVEGMVGIEGTVAYAASKFAVRGMTKVAALELGEHGIRVNFILPGRITVVKERDTSAVGLSPQAANGPVRVPLRRAGEPDEVARLAVFLASEDSSYATGAEFVLDGGWTSGYRLDFFEP